MIIYDEIEMISNNALRSFRGCTDTDVIVIEVAPSTKGQLRFHGAENQLCGLKVLMKEKGVLLVSTLHNYRVKENHARGKRYTALQIHITNSKISGVGHLWYSYDIESVSTCRQFTILDFLKTMCLKVAGFLLNQSMK
ncbi:hypothetical protein QLX08_002724 [Tetragonisca angustula]|uniref:Uncharacterized protein n=1 Tax=Tetragonisca angustula TaxID=166442 RepID=A0AAW1ACK2_9HYME